MGSRVLITSTGRTGTRSIADLLNRCDDRIEAHHITGASTLFNILSNMNLARLIPSTVINVLWTAMKDRHWRPRSEEQLFIDSNNHLYALARQLMIRYEDLLMVHIVRDPRAYVVSHLRWSRLRPKSYVANHVLPFWQPNGFLVGELSLRSWMEMDRFQRFCWIWNFKNRHMNATGEIHPGRYLRLRFEDLVSTNEADGGIARLGEFIGIPEINARSREALRHLNQTTPGDNDPLQNLSARQCRDIERICGPQMREYGYGNEPAWQERLRRR